jgi:hypothetical protein
MWWVPEDHRPGVAEAADKLQQLARTGESDAAFGWTHARARWGASG